MWFHRMWGYQIHIRRQNIDFGSKLCFVALSVRVAGYPSELGERSMALMSTRVHFPRLCTMWQWPAVVLLLLLEMCINFPIIEHCRGSPFISIAAATGVVVAYTWWYTLYACRLWVRLRATSILSTIAAPPARNIHTPSTEAVWLWQRHIGGRV